MLWQIVHKIITAGWMFLPLPLYSLYNHHYLDIKQAQLLLIQSILLVSLMLPGWLMHFIRLISVGYFVLIVLDLCIIEYEEFIGRYEVKPKHEEHRKDRGRAKNKEFRMIDGHKIFMIDYHRTLRKFKLNQTFILPIFIMLWLLLRMYFTKAQYYGIGLPLPDGAEFQGFLTTYNGWNCNYSQLTCIPLLYLIISVFCQYFLQSLLRTAKSDPSLAPEEYTDLNAYKIYLCKYLVTPSIIVLVLEVGFNWMAHAASPGLLDCYRYYSDGVLGFAVMCWGVPVCISLFFYVKVGRFSLQSSHENSQVENDEPDEHGHGHGRRH